MIFRPQKIADLFEIEPELRGDERGYFGRIFCENELREQGIDFRVRQANRSFNKVKNTLRGMHFQKPPKWESKIVTCVQGALYNIIVDLRPDSPTFKQWVPIELSAEKKNMMLVPRGCANGSQTLSDNCEVFYLMSEFYSPEHATGINYKDPQFNFVWPLGEPVVISEKDRLFPSYEH